MERGPSSDKAPLKDCEEENETPTEFIDATARHGGATICEPPPPPAEIAPRCDPSVLVGYFFHEDDVYNHRFQSFIGLQTVLFAVYGFVFSAIAPQGSNTLRTAISLGERLPTYLMSFGIPLLGLILSVVWWYTQSRQAFVFRHLRDHLRSELPYIDRIIGGRNSGLRFRPSNFSVMNTVPLLFVVFWLLTTAAVAYKEMTREAQTEAEAVPVVTIPARREAPRGTSPTTNAEDKSEEGSFPGTSTPQPTAGPK